MGRRADSAALWYAADLAAILVLGALAALGAFTGHGLTPGEAVTGILAVLAARLAPRGPLPPAGGAPAHVHEGPPPSRPRRAVEGSPGALRSLLLAAVDL